MELEAGVPVSRRLRYPPVAQLSDGSALARMRGPEVLDSARYLDIRFASTRIAPDGSPFRVI